MKTPMEETNKWEKDTKETNKWEKDTKGSGGDNVLGTGVVMFSGNRSIKSRRCRRSPYSLIAIPSKIVEFLRRRVPPIVHSG
jgi:hypothetical protein